MVLDPTILKHFIKFNFFLSGDAPACQLEIGQQKGGNYFCWGCNMKATRNEDMGLHVISRKIMQPYKQN